jgi:hypothetical protein
VEFEIYPGADVSGTDHRRASQYEKSNRGGGP